MVQTKIRKNRKHRIHRGSTVGFLRLLITRQAKLVSSFTKALALELAKNWRKR
jgi:hypothetical protein